MQLAPNMKLDKICRLAFVLAGWTWPLLCNGQAYPTGEKLFPAKAVVNVREGYGARGDGSTDDTGAIQQAISENIGKDRTLYFPDGVYMLSRPLKWVHIVGQDSLWRARLTIQGQSQAGTVLRLRTAASGFGNADAPKALVTTGSNRIRGRESTNGAGNNAFNNLICDLTVHTGTNNPGAVGIDFVGTNMAGLRNVTVESGDGRGVAGILLKREGSGPCLFKNVTVKGFDYGVDVYGQQYGQTYEFITLTKQLKAGIRNAGNVLSLRKVYSENAGLVPVIINGNRRNGQHPGNYGLVTLVDARFVRTGKTAAKSSAIVNEVGSNGRKGCIYVRNVVADGYLSVIENRNARKGTNRVAEFASDPVVSRLTEPNHDRAFALPVAETPEFHQNDTANWVSVTDYGASAEDPSGDDAKAIQAAIDSGAETVFFPKGKHPYSVDTTIVVRGNVRRLLGMQSAIDIGKNTFFKDTAQPRPVFCFAPGKHDTVCFERFNLRSQRASYFDGGVYLEHASPQTLVLRDLNSDAHGCLLYRNTAGVGSLFIENVCSLSAWSFANAQDVWARQLNPESQRMPVGRPMIFQNRGNLWILGLKTEGLSSVLQSENGRVELLGGFLYPIRDFKDTGTPAFSGFRSMLKLTFVVNAYKATASYGIVVKSNDSIHAHVLRKSNFERRGEGTIVPLCIVSSATKGR
jgi:hypothetical protein